MNTSATTVQKVWTTYGQFGFEAALYGNERIVIHSKLNKDVRNRIRELAASQPPAGYKRWSYRLLCDEAIKQGIVASCSIHSMKQMLSEQESIGSTKFRIHFIGFRENRTAKDYHEKPGNGKDDSPRKDPFDLAR